MQNTVNQRIKTLRKTLGMSQKSFAEKISLTSLAISRIETGSSTPRSSNLEKIIDVFGVDRDWLVNGVGEMTYSEPKEVPTESMEVAEAWRSKAEHLEKEVDFYRELLLNLTGKVNFLEAFDLIGFLPEKVIGSVRAAAA